MLISVKVGYTPDMLREQVAELKSYLNDKNAPFGVDLLLPQVGGSARKTKSVKWLRISNSRLIAIAATIIPRASSTN
jgi:hypothetical protein